MMKPKKKITIPWPREHQHPIGVRMPGTGYPFWRRVILSGGESVRVISLARACLVYRCHYIGGTYVPCLWDVHQDCPHHGGDNVPRLVYQGSLPVIMATGGGIWMANPTSAALHRGNPPFEERDDLLGRWLTLARRPGGRNAQMTVGVGELAAGSWTGKEIPWAETWRVQCNIWQVELEPSDFDEHGALPERGGPVQYPPLEGTDTSPRE